MSEELQIVLLAMGYSKKKNSFIVSCELDGVLFNVYLLLRISFVHICIIICPVLVVPKILFMVVLGSALLLGYLFYG